MPVGIQVINEGGLVQVDSDWFNYALISVETILTSDVHWRSLPCRAAIHSGSLDGDLVFAHCASNFLLLGTAWFDGLRRVGVSTGADGGGAIGVPVTFYVFRKQQPVASTFGLQIYDPSGALIFDAVSKFARIVGVLAPSSSTTKYNFGGNSKYAVLMPMFSGQFAQIREPRGYWTYVYANCLRFVCQSDGVQANGMAIGAFAQIPTDRLGNWISTIQGSPILVADVTGY